MSKWKMVKLGDVGEIVTGNTPPTKNKEFYNSDDSWISFHNNDFSIGWLK